MKYNLVVLLAVGIIVAALAVGASAKGLDAENRFSWVPMPDGPRGGGADGTTGARVETMWIFDADFNDLGNPHNQNWTTYDYSGTIGQENFWHKDTIRPKFAGDSTWWCGTYNVCWRQARGYGNNWIQYLERDFALSAMPAAHTFEFDQRFAMEHDYDYGYLDVSIDGGGSWTSLQSFTNPGFAGKPGVPQDWDSTVFPGGHFPVDMSAYQGTDIRLRFRFESDVGYSSADQFDNQAHSVRDGAWQVDNFEWNDGTTQYFYDDSQAPGDNGWEHEDLAATGQEGYVFFRGLYMTDFETGRTMSCEDREGWMYAAVDPFTSKMVDNMNTILISPPIDISGAPKLIGQWDMWVDLPKDANDIFNLLLASHDLKDCVTDPEGFVDESPGAWYGGPFWGTWTDDWDAFAGNDWLSVRWDLYNQDPALPGTHMAGIFLNRQRVGVPSADPSTVFNYSVWYRFHDWFGEELVAAGEDSAIIEVKDDDGVSGVELVASNDFGANWSRYDMVRPQEETNNWYGGPPVDLMQQGKEIWYYFESTDELQNTAIFPTGAPERHYEFSILPINATVSNPGILLVDKHGRRIPGEDRSYGIADPEGLTWAYSQYYYYEPLEILGYEFEVYDVEVPSGSTAQSDGPDSSGYKYYDTQIWWATDFNAYTIKVVDQFNIIQWLSVADPPAKKRNLLLAGNDIGYELEQSGADSHDLYDVWLKCDWISDAVDDTLPTLIDAAGGFDFFPGRECLLAGGCPDPIEMFDVIDPLTGGESVVKYRRGDLQTFNAGVAYEHQTYGYKTVTLGFGLEVMVDSQVPPEAGGYFVSGAADRAAFVDSIMRYFAKLPTAVGTGVSGVGVKNELSQAYPNPFNPITNIAYSIGEAGPVTIQIHNVAGRVVRTLLETELEAGTTGHVVWDGRNDLGEQCASGVYFYRIQAPGFANTKKMVMLK